MTNHASPAAPHLARDDRGAIMVIGVFMAIVLVGLLYYMSGLGQMLFRRERMQDAADAVALATAIGHARGMNLIAFINMVMAALVAIVLALKIIELLLTGLALLLVAISWFVPPAGAAVPIVNNARSIVKDVHDAARDIVDNILIGLNMAERAIRVITPVQSVLTAKFKIDEKYGDVTDFAIAVPTRLTLPVENDKYDTLCDEGGKILQNLITSVTDGIPFIGKVIDIAVGALMGAVKNAYCYKDGSQVPPTPIDFDRALPISQTPGLDCEADKAEMNAGSENCQNWEQELRDRHPESDGNCPSSGDRATLCANSLSAARDQCDVSRMRNRENYSWAAQEVKEIVVFDTARWEWKTIEYSYVGGPTLANTTDHGSAMETFNQAQSDVNGGSRPDFEQIERETPRTGGKPCDNGNVSARDTLQPELLWSEWNAETTWAEVTWTTPGQAEPERTKPVCTKKLAEVKRRLPNQGEIPERTRDGRPPPGFEGEFPLQYATIKQVYGCTQEATLDVVFPSEWESATAAQGGEDKAPQKMEEGVLLGSGDFQIRGVALLLGGELRSEKVDKGIRHAAFERQVESEAWVDLARNSGRIAISQAEYYFNHNGVTNADVYDWMWHMDWRARLVRFRLPGDDEEENDSNEESDMDVASMVPDSDLVGTDLSAIDMPEGVPSLDLLDQLLTH